MDVYHRKLPMALFDLTEGTGTNSEVRRETVRKLRKTEEGI